MKISTMLAREDFYRINSETLERYFFAQGACGSKTLYVYPHLNAIVARCPSKAVKKFIYTEYQVSGARWRKIAVWLYARAAMNSFGLLSSKRIRLNGSGFMNNGKLIYPCNRKHRIFDFENGFVDVVLKAGFPDTSIHNEMEFRKKNVPDFVLPLITHGTDTYREQILDGIPLVRISEEPERYYYEAMKIWRGYTDKFDQEIQAHAYADELQSRLETKINVLKSGCARNEAIDCVSSLALAVKALDDSAITVTMSHGDLQQGNLWVENKTGKIYIIDWESYGRRIKSYDDATFWGGIRSPQGITEFMKASVLLEHEKYLVCLEDILYRVDEVMSLPDDFGVNEFNSFIGEVLQCLSL